MIQHFKKTGFTLVETLVAISILSIAVVAPMSLVSQGLISAFYARDQVIAYFLAQEAIESVRNVRDGNILLTAYGTPTNLMNGIPVNGAPFVIDTRNNQITSCSGTCPQLKTDGTFYAHGATPFSMSEPGWTPTPFTRTVTAAYVKNPDTTDNLNEITVTVTMSWRSGSLPPRSFSLSENMYRWIDDTI